MGEWRTSKYGYTHATVTNLHTGGPGHRVALHWIEAAVEFGSRLRDWAALFRTALPTSWHEEGARKGALNIVCFTSPWPANRGSAGIPLAVERQQRRRSIWLLH